MIPWLILLKVLIISFLINLLWEVSHSALYKTCLDMHLKKYVKLILSMSFKDGLWISLFYAVTILVFKNTEILLNYLQLSVFVVLCLGFAFIDEKVSIKHKRWEYSPKMPIIFGVGVTPLLELAVTGVLAFVFVFLL